MNLRQLAATPRVIRRRNLNRRKEIMCQELSPGVTPEVDRSDRMLFARVGFNNC